MEKADIQGALLQILSHDLLAPITAIKWQSELLSKSKGDVVKQEKYIEGIRDSAEISIALLQYVAITGTVLRGEHSEEMSEKVISEVLEEAWRHIEPQYARHGVSLDLSFDAAASVKRVDVRLLQVFVWCVAKFFLASAVARETVRVKGLCLGGEDQERQRYVMAVSVNNVTDASYYEKVFNDQTKQLVAGESIFHAQVFAELIRTVARDAHVLFSAGTESDIFTLEFSLHTE
jgi:light-regulated signal transduction histidine kinase (bacteriophytochrome)